MKNFAFKKEWFSFTHCFHNIIIYLVWKNPSGSAAKKYQLVILKNMLMENTRIYKIYLDHFLSSWFIHQWVIVPPTGEQNKWQLLQKKTKKKKTGTLIKKSAFTQCSVVCLFYSLFYLCACVCVRARVCMCEHRSCKNICLKGLLPIVLQFSISRKTHEFFLKVSAKRIGI